MRWSFLEPWCYSLHKKVPRVFFGMMSVMNNVELCRNGGQTVETRHLPPNLVFPFLGKLGILESFSIFWLICDIIISL